jgi:GDP-L-fucose synthase
MSTVLTTDSSIFLVGHGGMVGSAILRKMQSRGFNRVITRTRQELNLLDQEGVFRFLREAKVDYVVLAAARVGGIVANNTYPADFIYQNLAIQNNVIHGAYQAGVKRLLFLGSSCIYPKLAPQPMKEECLLTGRLEPTNEPYAIAKIAGIKMCESYNRQYGTRYRSVMPTNLYGPNDNFNISNSHVVPALIRKAHEAKISAAPTMEVWGSDRVLREFLHVDDLADACLFVMSLDDGVYGDITDPMLSHINVGAGHDVSIEDLARRICRMVGYEGKLRFNSDMPEGALQKLLDVTKLNRLGWHAGIGLEEGLAATYQWFLENREGLRD